MFRILVVLLILSMGLSACGKKKEKDVLSELSQKPSVRIIEESAEETEIQEEPEPKFVNNSTSPINTDIPDAPIAPPPPPAQTSLPTQAPVPDSSAADSQAPGGATQEPVQQTGYVVPALKVDPNAPPPPPPSAPAPYPPYQGYQPPPQGGYANPYGGYPPPPPKKYVPPGPIESLGEFVGHLVNPFKRDEDESRKEYKGI